MYNRVFILQFVHTEIVVTLVASEFFFSGIARHNFKLAFRFAFRAFTVDSFSWHGSSSTITLQAIL